MNLLATLPPALLVDQVLSKLSQRDVLTLVTSCHALLTIVEQHARVLNTWSKVKLPGGHSLKRKAESHCSDLFQTRVSLLKKRSAFIKSLTIQCFRAGNEDFRMALHCPMLRHLDVRSLQPLYFTSDMLELVSQQCPLIESLGVHPSTFVDVQTPVFPKLTKLLIASGMTSHIQSYFTFPLHQLQELHLVDFGLCHGVILSLCTSLRSLSIVRCWRTTNLFEDHAFHVDDPLFAAVLCNLESFTLCSSDSAMCLNSAYQSIFIRAEWPRLHTLVVDSAAVPHMVCDLQVVHDVAHEATNFVCLYCDVHSWGEAAAYNLHYKDSSLLLGYRRCSACRAKHASTLSQMSILWW